MQTDPGGIPASSFPVFFQKQKQPSRLQSVWKSWCDIKIKELNLWAIGIQKPAVLLRECDWEDGLDLALAQLSAVPNIICWVCWLVPYLIQLSKVRLYTSG